MKHPGRWLWLLLLVPAVVIVYLLLLRRKKKAALRYASLSLVKDAMSREILDEFDRAKISIASGTHDVVGFPELKVRLMDGK